jgi:hypothetical protein
MIAIPLIALLVGCLCLTVFTIQLWTVYRKEKAQEERLRWLEHEHMVLEQKVYELRVEKLKEKEIEKGIVEILTENQKQIETLEKNLEVALDLLCKRVRESVKADLKTLYPPSTKSTEEIIYNPKENYRKHIVNKYTATRRATTSSYVTTPEYIKQEERLKANTIQEIIKRLNTAEKK